MKLIVGLVLVMSLVCCFIQIGYAIAVDTAKLVAVTDVGYSISYMGEVHEYLN